MKPDAGMHASLVEFEPEKLPHNERNIGIDVGLEAFATLSDGTRIENHRYYKAAQAQLRRAHRKVARRHTKSRSVVIKPFCCCRWRTNTLGTNGETFSTS